MKTKFIVISKLLLKARFLIKNSVYTDEQKNFIKKLHNEIRRSQELWKEHVESWGDRRGKTFFVDLNYFVGVVQYAIMNSELKLATKVLGGCNILCVSY